MAINKGKHIIRNFLFPDTEPEWNTAMDWQSMRNISNVGLAACIFETLTILVFMTVEGWKFEGASLRSFYSVGFCALFSLIVFLLSKRMMKNQELSHRYSLIFKITFFVIFSIWAIQVDMRHYAAGDQMFTFYTVQLLVACFIMFEPWISIILVSAAYVGLYAAAYRIQRAEGIDIFNFALFAILTALCMCIQYHTQLYLIRKEERLNLASHRDALTGLRNRLALEEDAQKLFGKPLMLYMIDIDYFKELNDHFGHVLGDEILKETGLTLQKLYPGAMWYRYGGDEFLVLSTGDGSRNYTGQEYKFEKQSQGRTFAISLSIGSTQGEPQAYDELFVLISKADAALYEAKARTHSPEYGGHERRRRR